LELACVAARAKNAVLPSTSAQPGMFGDTV
jgi:hypothetical protein